MLMPVVENDRKGSVKRSIVWILFILILWWLLACSAQPSADPCGKYSCVQGAVVRGDTTRKELTLVLTGDQFADGGAHIQAVLKKLNVKAAFFFTGNFYRNPAFHQLINGLKGDGHYLGAHSDRHLLYCAWENRDSLLVTKEQFTADLAANYAEMKKFGIEKTDVPFFLPPFEWYNDSISTWTRQWGLQLVNFSSGTRSTADYTTPDLPNYRSSEEIYSSILAHEQKDPNGLNGFLLLVHIGTAPERTDKFYFQLEALVNELTSKGYRFVPLTTLLAAE